MDRHAIDCAMFRGIGSCNCGALAEASVQVKATKFAEAAASVEVHGMAEVSARDLRRSIMAAMAPAARRYFETVLEANDGCCLSDADDRAKVLEALCALFS